MNLDWQVYFPTKNCFHAQFQTYQFEVLYNDDSKQWSYAFLTQDAIRAGSTFTHNFIYASSSEAMAAADEAVPLEGFCDD